MEIKPIKTEQDYDQALAQIERLMDTVPGTPEGDQLDVLTTLVEAYETQHFPVPPPDPIEAILYYMDSRGLSRRDLEPYLGSRARVAEVLSRKRALSITMIRRLHQGLDIPLEVLIQPHPLADAGPMTAVIRPPFPPPVADPGHPAWCDDASY
jgi:HTH-type transcriptional regulator/antitoxin HigA